jgi:hypothetical protein
MRRFTEAFREVQGLVPGKRKAKAVRQGMAAFASVELSGTGHVHLHAVVYGPFIQAGWLESKFGGFLIFERLGDSCEGLVKEAAKYAAKICSPLDEGWLRGDEREVIHPELAARWEAATWRLRLRRVFGELHGRMSEEPCDEVPMSEELSDEGIGEQKPLTEGSLPSDPCKVCGSSEHWANVLMRTEDWVSRNHELKQRALRYSRWKPFVSSEQTMKPP